MTPREANSKVQELIDDLGEKMDKADYLNFLEQVGADVSGKIDCVSDELEDEE